MAAFGGFPPEKIVGAGAGLVPEKLQLKGETVKKAITINQPDPGGGLDVLSKVGGLEIAGLVGCILGAAAWKVPIIIDGFISTAAAQYQLYYTFPSVG